MVGERHSEIGRPESDSSVQGGGEGELFLSKSSREKKKEKKRNVVARKKMRNSTETSPRSSLARNNRWSETGLAESTNIGFNKAHKSCIRLCIVERDGWTRPRFLFFWSPANPRTSLPQNQPSSFHDLRRSTWCASRRTLRELYALLPYSSSFPCFSSHALTFILVSRIREK